MGTPRRAARRCTSRGGFESCLERRPHPRRTISRFLISPRCACEGVIFSFPRHRRFHEMNHCSVPKNHGCGSASSEIGCSVFPCCSRAPRSLTRSMNGVDSRPKHACQCIRGRPYGIPFFVDIAVRSRPYLTPWRSPRRHVKAQWDDAGSGVHSDVVGKHA